MLRNGRRVLREQSRFKTVFIGLFALALVVGLDWVFSRGFRFVGTLGQTGNMILARLLALFFLGMALMLIVSGALAAYTTLFRSAEMPFLRIHPVRRGDITVYKAIESAALASWAFYFIIVPFTLAYARHQALSLAFTVWTLVMATPFLLLCAGIGALLMLLVSRFMPWRIRGPWPGILLLTVAIAVGVWLLAGQRGAAGDETLFVLGRLIPGFRLAANRFLPPFWIAEGIQSLARGQWLRGFMFWGLLSSHALLLGLLIESPGGRWFETAWQRSLTTSRRHARGPARPGMQWSRWLPGFAPATRAMMVKDIRTFLRDPAQWSQGLIFFGLLALYFANLRTLRYHQLPDGLRSAIAFLNMFSLATVMCSLSSRFIFPQLSLEGQAFWLLGLAPVPRGRILAAKAATALTATLVVGWVLMLISSLMLKVVPEVRWIALGIGTATACAFTGLSVGLGAVFMDLRQSNPAAIVSGFGGTLNLVLSLGFMLAAIIPFALVQRFQVLIRDGWGWWYPLAGAWVWLIVLTVATMAIPLRLGYRALQDRDY